MMFLVMVWHFASQSSRKVMTAHTRPHVFFKKLLSWEISLQFHGYVEMGSCLSRSKGTHTRKRRKSVLDKPSQSFLSSSVVLGFRGYASFAGWEIIGIILVSTALMQASRNGGDLWLSFWVDTLTSSTSPHLVSYYLVGIWFIYKPIGLNWKNLQFACTVCLFPRCAFL
jgi:hypothetical protein